MLFRSLALILLLQHHAEFSLPPHHQPIANTSSLSKAPFHLVEVKAEEELICLTAQRRKNT